MGSDGGPWPPIEQGGHGAEAVERGTRWARMGKEGVLTRMGAMGAETGQPVVRLGILGRTASCCAAMGGRDVMRCGKGA